MKKYIVYWRFRGCVNTSLQNEFIQSEKQSKIELENAVLLYLQYKYGYKDISVESITGIDFIKFVTV